MLITQLKAKETITSLTAGKKIFIINCHGCKEVHFPEKEAVELQKGLAAEGNVTGIMTTDYICNPENIGTRSRKQIWFWYSPAVSVYRPLPNTWMIRKSVQPVILIRYLVSRA